MVNAPVRLVVAPGQSTGGPKVTEVSPTARPEIPWRSPVSFTYPTNEPPELPSGRGRAGEGWTQVVRAVVGRLAFDAVGVTSEPFTTARASAHSSVGGSDRWLRLNAPSGRSWASCAS